VDNRVVPGTAVLTQDSLRRSTVGKFVASVARDINERAINRLVSTQRRV